ncbi:hypothetical protein [Streptomyces luteireticuli]|uniref:hypothetical protein n=1 Tax=Streptomyces luteireticuli TaxID=173858 RepID=UPI003557B7DC
MISEDWAGERAVIKADMLHAVTLDFRAYVAYLGAYGAKLRALAAGHPHPDEAFHAFRAYADKALSNAYGSGA